MKNKIRVCFFNSNAYSLFNPESKAPIGGAEVDLFNVANYLAGDNNFKISFIVGDWGQMKEEMYGSIKIVRLSNLRRSWRDYIKAPFLFWWKLFQVEANVYITEAAGTEVGLLAVFCKVFGKKFIYRTASQIDCDGTFVRENGLLGKVFQFGLKNADILITQNEEHQTLLKKQGINSVVIKNAHRIENNKDLIGIFKQKRYILWVARCDKGKKPELFLKLAEKFPNQQFLMIAPMVDHERDLFNRVSKQAERLDNLEFIEKVDFFKIQKYFDEAKLFIGTSDYEGFPNTYLQACMGGTPIISLNVNPDKFIAKGNLGYCAGGNFNLMIKQIKELLDNKKLRLEKSKNALKYVKENHDIKKIGKQWANLIENLI